MIINSIIIISVSITSVSIIIYGCQRGRCRHLSVELYVHWLMEIFVYGPRRSCAALCKCEKRRNFSFHQRAVRCSVRHRGPLYVHPTQQQQQQTTNCSPAAAVHLLNANPKCEQKQQLAEGSMYRVSGDQRHQFRDLCPNYIIQSFELLHI